MDPVAALSSILSGHLVADHAEALRDWLYGGGFTPECLLPVDCHVMFAEHCITQYGNADEGRTFRADGLGIWSYDAVRDDWWLAANWAQLARVDDSEF